MVGDLMRFAKSPCARPTPGQSVGSFATKAPSRIRDPHEDREFRYHPDVGAPMYSLSSRFSRVNAQCPTRSLSVTPAASPDARVAAAACAALEAAAIPCWMAPRDIVPGMQYGAAVIDAIVHAKLVVLVLSSHANASAFVALEVERAVSNRRPIIPLRIEPVTPSKGLELFIGAAHWLDTARPPGPADFDRLVRAAGEHLGAPPPPPDTRARRNSIRNPYPKGSMESAAFRNGRFKGENGTPRNADVYSADAATIRAAYNAGYDTGAAERLRRAAKTTTDAEETLE
jgi:hypothetical protein